jgi:diguanylate cyclase (GGDEF)-like protein/PAS domain S-box-containing protein
MNFRRPMVNFPELIQKPEVLLIFFMITLAVAGSLYMSYTWSNSLAAITDQVVTLAVMVELSLQRDVLGDLGNPQNNNQNPGYQQIKTILEKVAAANNDIRVAYIYTKKDGKVYLIADSRPASFQAHALPGLEYVRTHPQFIRPFFDRKPLVTRPITDRWGTWVSVLVPIKDDSGQTMAVLGMDYSVVIWNRHAIVHTVQSGMIIICLFWLLIAYYKVSTRNIALNAEKNKLTVANMKLKEQETLFRTIFEQSPLGLAFGDGAQKLAVMNSMFEKITGRSKKEIEDLSWDAMIHPDDLPYALEKFAQIKAGENNGYSMIVRYFRPDGSIAWVKLTITPIVIDNQTQLSHLYIIADITEHVRAEEALRESERSHAMLLSNLPGMAYRCNYDRDWTMQFVSEGCFELAGYKPESLIQNAEISFNDLIKPEYRELIWEKWTQALLHKKVFRDEYPITTASAEIRWVLEQGRGIYAPNGEVVAIEGLIIDITARKEREEEIEYLNYHDVLTGLYSRRFFEREKERVDHPDQLPVSVIIGDINGLKLINDAWGHAEGDKLIVTIAEILSGCCRRQDILARTGGDEFSILLPKTSNEIAYQIIKRIETACEEYRNNTPDMACHTHISLGCATKKSADESLKSIIKDAEDRMYRSKLLQKGSFHSSVIASMKTTLFEKSQETQEHAGRLIELSRAVGQKMKLTNEQLNELELLSTLHDIGKIAIKDCILNKPGKLTEAEWAEMKKHPGIGYRIAMASPELAPIADYILYHHERWDGNGYPQGLKEEDIPLLSRIIAITDAFDAMTEDRPYRKAMTREAALAEIERNAGTQFDPKIARLFIELVAAKRD